MLKRAGRRKNRSCFLILWSKESGSAKAWRLEKTLLYLCVSHANACLSG